MSVLGPDPGVRPNKSVNEQHSLPVFYDQVLAAKGFPSPLIRARVGQQEVLFIVDTGAGVNTLAAWLVEEAGIATKHTGSTARGSTGEESPVSVTYGVRGTWSDGRTFELHEAIVVQFPPLFKTYRIGGLVSPQLLAPPGSAAVLDLTKPSLDFQALDQALAAIGNVSQASPPGLVTVCRNPESQFVNVLYSAPIRVSGEAGTVLVDTGATVTILQPDSAIGRKGVKSFGKKKSAGIWSAELILRHSTRTFHSSTPKPGVPGTPALQFPFREIAAKFSFCSA